MITPPTRQREHPASQRPRPQRQIGWRAIFALAGLLLWAALAAPRIIALAPGMSQQAATAAHFVASAPGFWTRLAETGPSSSAMSRAPHNAPGGGAAALGGDQPSACTSTQASAIGSNLVIPSGAFVCGPAMVTGGNLTIYGHVQGTAQSIGGSTVVYGEVDGDISVIGGDITIEPGASALGALHVVGGSAHILPGAYVTQRAERNTVSPRQAFDALAPHAFAFWLSLIFWIFAAVGVTAVAPEAVGHVRYTIAQNFLLSGAVGAAIAIAGVVIGLVLLLTCVGAIVTIAIAIALWLGWIVGAVAFASWLGESLLRGLHLRRYPSLLTSAVLGVILITLLKSAPILGFVVSLVVGCVGLGAAGLTLLSARRVSYKRLSW